MNTHDHESRYDVRTAITFLLAGLGLGALTALILGPRRVLGTLPPRIRPRSQWEAAILP